jgi:hypothetical protein
MGILNEILDKLWVIFIENSVPKWGKVEKKPKKV